MFARANNQSVCCSSFIAGGSFKAVNETFVEHWVADEECGANLLQLEGPDGIVRQVEGEEGVVHNLFAFPAEDNFAGVLAGCGDSLCYMGVLDWWWCFLRWGHCITGAKGVKAEHQQAQWRVLVSGGCSGVCISPALFHTPLSLALLSRISHRCEIPPALDPADQGQEHRQGAVACAGRCSSLCAHPASGPAQSQP